MDTALAKRSAKPTPLVVVAPDAAGHPAYTFHAHDCADRDVAEEDLPPALGPGVDAVAIGSWPMVAEPVGGALLALAAVALIAILVSYVAIEPLGLRASQMGILRAALVGMVFQTSASFCFIFLLYFDLRRHALAVSATYCILNGTLTAALLPLGFPFFGYGNLFASALTFLLAVTLLAHELPWLHFHAFVTNNTSLRPAEARARPVRPPGPASSSTAHVPFAPPAGSSRPARPRN